MRLWRDDLAKVFEGYERIIEIQQDVIRKLFSLLLPHLAAGEAEQIARQVEEGLRHE